MLRLTGSRVGPEIKGLLRVKRQVKGSQTKTFVETNLQHQHALRRDMGTLSPQKHANSHPPLDREARLYMRPHLQLAAFCYLNLGHSVLGTKLS